MSEPDAGRLAAVVSPLRRMLLGAARSREHLPDLPDAQIEVIRALPAGTVLAPSTLAERLGVQRSTVSNLLKSMERAGLVERRAAPGDGRGVEVEASARALDLFDRFDLAAAAVVAEATAQLSPPDRDAIAAAVPALERLLDALRSSPQSGDRVT